MTVWLRGDDSAMKLAVFLRTPSRAGSLPQGIFCEHKFCVIPRSNVGASLLAIKVGTTLDDVSHQSSRALAALGDKRRLRKLRFTLLRWLTKLGPRAMATPIASTSITTRCAMREVSGV